MTCMCHYVDIWESEFNSDNQSLVVIIIEIMPGFIVLVKLDFPEEF